MIASINALLESLQHISGFFFVLFVLTTLWLVIAILGSVFKRLEKRASNRKMSEAATTTPVVAGTSSDEVPDEDLVLIATTVAMLLGQKPYRLISIRTTGLGWGQEGRRQHVMSHKIK